MRNTLLWRLALVALVGASSPAAHIADAGADAPRVPVVVELFSSEGCSSCPPADVLLARLDQQTIPGVEVIALEFHVDYWNSLGWRDPFSQAAFSARQRMHAFAMRSSRIYTPQMIVDGGEELIGSSATGAGLAIRRAALAPHVPVKIVRQGDMLTIDAGAAPANEGASQIMLATTERGCARA